MTVVNESGVRLARFEVYNWGTFNERAWVFNVDGENALLTGEIGSGKSTIVDGITTLLVPAHRVSYNKAAGAGSRERDLRSYVLGHYKSARVEATGATRPVALRTVQNYSVLLGVFNTGSGTVSVAQVFRPRDEQSQPDRFFLVADSDLSIAEHFSDIGDSLKQMKLHLRSIGARVYDHFPEYGRDMRRSLGIASEQALDLFHQTVSMKSVDNLTEFVRSHMLEPFDMSDRIEALLSHFDDLTAAHDAVLRARDQVGALEPLIAALDEHADSVDKVEVLDRTAKALPVHFAACRLGLLEEHMDALSEKLAVLNREIAAVDAELVELRDIDRQLTVDLVGAGGNRLTDIDREVQQLKIRWPERQQALRDLNAKLVEAGLDEVVDEQSFDRIAAAATARTAVLEAELAGAMEHRSELTAELKTQQAEIERINADMHSLSAGGSNLPRTLLQIRDEIASELKVASSDIPFAGELLRVRDTSWEGAAERVLRSFATSMLVPDRLYTKVSAWMEGRHLGTRIVYFRVPEHVSDRRTAQRQPGVTLLSDLLEVRPGTEFAGWLNAELAYRADHVCVDDMEAFRRAAKAVTRSGQVKSRDRHEKDDRRKVDDRRDFVLGWSSTQKAEALVAHAAALHEATGPLREEISRADANCKTLAEAVTNVTRVAASAVDWDRFDWKSDQGRIERLEAEKVRISSESDMTAAIGVEQMSVRERIASAEQERQRLQSQAGGVESDMARTLERVGSCQPGDDDDMVDVSGFIPNEDLETLDAVDRAERVALNSVDRARVDARDRVTRAAQQAVRQMTAFRGRYPTLTKELDDSLASADGYREFHARLVEDDLPRFEEAFREALHENTVHEVAGVLARLEASCNVVRDRVAKINESLRNIDYNPGRYIMLLAEPTPNVEIREFRESLREVTADMSNGDYSEARFMKVKAILDRFKGREGFVDIDRVWAAKVTDVRQWFVFAASERWRSDDTEHESYTDSDGKSGGQKEKLAYLTISASLTYQYGLDEQNTSGFRFVVIDEAFGRGSDESTRYALNLFTQLGLQMLIVTPKQKVNVICAHTPKVGVVANLDGGRYSTLRNLSLTEVDEMRSGGRPVPAAAG